MKKQFLTATSLLTVLALTGCIGGDVISNADASEKDNTNPNAVLIEVPEAEPDTETLPETEVSEENSEPDNMVNIDYTDSDAYLLMSEDDSWKEIYADFLENDLKEIIPDFNSDGYKGWEYGFIFINNDYIPELVLLGDTEVQGNIILTIANGKVENIRCARKGLYYKEFGNLINNSDGHMGYCYDYIFAINEDGFETVLNGEFYDEHTGPEGNPIKWIYSIDGTELSKEEYYETIEATIPYEDRKYLSGGGTYLDTLNYLKGQTPSDYKEAYSELIRNGVMTRFDEVTDFALLERENGVPYLVCKGKGSFIIYSYENGLLQKTLDAYLSESNEVTIYPEIGVSRTKYLNNENDITIYEDTYNSGAIFYKYSAVHPERDDEYNTVTDESGNPILVYTVEFETVDKDAYEEYESKYDNEKSYSPDDLDYYSETDMLEILASDL